MRAPLAALSLLLATGLANAENLPTPASSSQTSGSVGASTTQSATPSSGQMSGSIGASTSQTRRTDTPVPTSMPPRSKAEAAAEFKSDLALCRSLMAEERRNCERETHAARAEGLYK